MIVPFDTNILLDVLQNRQPHYGPASRAWDLVERHVLAGYVSAISFNNVFYILRKQLGSAAALDAVKQIRALFKCVTLDEQLLDQALATCTIDLEDAIQAAAADRVTAEYIVTRNVKDFASLKIRAVNAGELMASIGA